MDVSAQRLANPCFERVTSLTANIDDGRYSLFKYESPLNRKLQDCFFLLEGGPISLFVVEGVLGIVPTAAATDPIYLGREEGVHIEQGSSFQLTAHSLGTEFLVASSGPALLLPRSTGEGNGGTGGRFTSTPFSPYKVNKPWGYERWFTHNIADKVPYALKLIYMEEGRRSSLQSHIHKSETNLILEGRTKVYSGLRAPEDLSSRVDVSRLSSKTYEKGEGWSNPIGELHQVVALENYKAVEISTPELDDVIRWQDDQGRGHGKIESEHKEKCN